MENATPKEISFYDLIFISHGKSLTSKMTKIFDKDCFRERGGRKNAVYELFKD